MLRTLRPIGWSVGRKGLRALKFSYIPPGGGGSGSLQNLYITKNFKSSFNRPRKGVWEGGVNHVISLAPILYRLGPRRCYKM